MGYYQKVPHSHWTSGSISMGQDPPIPAEPPPMRSRDTYPQGPGQGNSARSNIHGPCKPFNTHLQAQIFHPRQPSPHRWGSSGTVLHRVRASRKSMRKNSWLRGRGMTGEPGEQTLFSPTKVVFTAASVFCGVTDVMATVNAGVLTVAFVSATMASEVPIGEQPLMPASVELGTNMSSSPAPKD